MQCSVPHLRLFPLHLVDWHTVQQRGRIPARLSGGPPPRLSAHLRRRGVLPISPRSVKFCLRRGGGLRTDPGDADTGPV